jgi:RyR domain
MGRDSPRWKPQPIDTTTVRLPPPLQALIDRLAQNTHDVWARQRLCDGWTHGPTRDDVAKHHPGLVPYSALPESEKNYDRKTAIETLKVIIALGYAIERRSHGNG